MADAPTVIGSFPHAKLTATGWCDVAGNVCYAGAINGDSILSIDFSVQATPVLLDILTDAVELNGTEFVGIFPDGYLHATSLYANKYHVVDISNPSSMSIVETVTHDGVNFHLAQPAGVAYVDNLAGYGRIVFVACYSGDYVTALNITDPLNITEIGTMAADVPNMNQIINVAYKNGYLFGVARAAKTFVVIDVSDPTSMSVVTTIDNSVTGANGTFERLGGLNPIYPTGNYLYVPCSTSDTLNIVNIADPENPYIEGKVTDTTQLEGAYVPAPYQDEYCIVSARYGNRVTVVDVRDKTTPVIPSGQSTLDATNLEGTDDVHWDSTLMRAFVTCAEGSRITILRIPILEQIMATLSKTWTAAVELHSTDAFGGSDAVLAADQAYDYTADVNLETNGYEGAQVLVEVMLNYGDRDRKDPQAPDDVIVDVFASLDGSLYDTVPYSSVTVKSKRNTRTQRVTILVEELAHFRIGLRTTDTQDTFDYRITHQTWLTDNS